MFAGTWREGQGGLLGAEALHGEVAGVVERVLGELAAGAHAQGLGLAGHGLDADAAVALGEGGGDGLGGGAREVDAQVDGGRLGDGLRAGQRALGADLLDHASGEPAGDRPAQGQGLEGLAARRTSRRARRPRGRPRRAPPARGHAARRSGSNSWRSAWACGDRHVGGAAELTQLEHREAQQLAQAGAQARGLVGEGVDHRVEAGAVAQHAVDQEASPGRGRGGRGRRSTPAGARRARGSKNPRAGRADAGSGWRDRGGSGRARAGFLARARGRVTPRFLVIVWRMPANSPRLALLTS